MKLCSSSIVVHRSGHSHQIGDSGLPLGQVELAHARPEMLCIVLYIQVRTTCQYNHRSTYLYVCSAEAVLAATATHKV